jgi:hypothetical protein
MLFGIINSTVSNYSVFSSYLFQCHQSQFVKKIMTACKVNRHSYLIRYCMILQAMLTAMGKERCFSNSESKIDKMYQRCI